MLLTEERARMQVVQGIKPRPSGCDADMAGEVGVTLDKSFGVGS